tara:strand:- start:801 stop:980 length:180 start_codon:yes stop_codon:yes gene_type:complete
MNFKKLRNILNNDTLNKANEFVLYDGNEKIVIINERLESASSKDQPQAFYTNQIIIEQL